MNVKLTATQTTILKTAAARSDGNIEPLPTNLRGGAKTAVIDGLLARNLITKIQHAYYLTDAAYAAVGRKRKFPTTVIPDPETEAAMAAAEAKWRADDVAKHGAIDDLQKLKGTRTAGIPSSHTAIRSGTKLATVIDCLRHPDGATIDQIMQLTNWQAHTIRGAISGMLRKKLGLAVASERGIDGHRTYRLT